jgi:ATP-dependent helicase/nuclease subunit A
VSATFTPRDQDVRDSIRVDIDVNLCVEAGAGTGKTTVLVDRIVEVLRRGQTKVQNVAVITFTEKAAAELAARVRDGLDRALQDAATPAAERAAIDEAIRGLNLAHIETIHAFAAGLLRERPIEADLDPGFDVLVDLPAQLEFEEAYDEWLTAALAAEPPPDAVIDALNLGLEFGLVREAAHTLHEQRDLLPLPAYQEEPVDLPRLLADIDAQLTPVRDLRPLDGVKDRAHEALVAACELRDQLELLRTRPDVLRRAVATADIPSPQKGNQNNWHSKQYCKDVKAAVTEVVGLLHGARDAMRAAATARLLAWLQDFVSWYELRRRAAGKADFQDLLIWARRLVRERADVRSYFQAKYQRIFIDEFQDTDPLQVELVVYLCEDGARAVDWRDVVLRPGSLFVVGDPKQSIYRFRRADIAMYDAVKQRVFSGEVRAITQNFRSHPKIVDWVNNVFRDLITEAPGRQPRYIDLEPRPDLPDAVARPVVVLRGEESGSNASATRTAEANALASLIRGSIDSGEWRVRDGDGGARPARYRDVAVLIPSRTDLQIYEEACTRAGVPYRHEGGRTFFQRQEVRELVAILRAIDDPSDAVAAIAALRSSAFGCSDEDLLLHKAAGGGFDHQRVRDGDTGPAAAALRKLAELSSCRHERQHANPLLVGSLPELVRAVLDEMRLVEFAMLQPQGDQVAANLLKMIDQARAFAAASGGGLRGFVRWLKENIARTTDETDAAISEETDDVVRIVTIHMSKGLEFPIVLFANMNTARRNWTKVIADRTGTGGLHVQLGKKENAFLTPGFEAADAAERLHADAEDMRLLYVAATRAKDLLVVPFITKGPAGKEALNDRLRNAAVGYDVPTMSAADISPLDAEVPVWRRAPLEAPEQDTDRVIEEARAWKAWHDDVLIDGAAAALRVVTATSLKDDATWERPGASDVVRRARAADFGTAVHSVLERVDLAQPDDVPRHAEIAAAEHGMADRVDEMATVARTALASAVIARALRSPRRLREVAFAAPLPLSDVGEGGVAEGRIDLLFQEDSGIVIVDFKTDNVTAADVDARTEEYRAQALTYAWAAHEATGLPVREVVFLYARPGIERSVGVDAEFMAEAGAMMRAAAPA